MSRKHVVPKYSGRQVYALRGPKNKVSNDIPYAFLCEDELAYDGQIKKTAVIFLTNSECPYRCLMCDLWKNTSEEPVPAGAIPRQVEYALSRLPDARQVKLYNSGSFFDSRAIPPGDHRAIASMLKGFETVIVENHPRLTDRKCVEFNDMLDGKLEIAMGLETCDDVLLKRLNKGMRAAHFRAAAEFLKENNMRSRAFILLRPPYLTEDEAVTDAIRSVKFAFDSGSECCTIIPVRGGNGVMERLREEGLFTPPAMKSLEKVQEYGISLGSGRVFADTWDLDKFSDCNICFASRKERIEQMNLTQEIPPEIICSCPAADKKIL